MPFQVEGQVVRSGEGPLTHSTLKRFVAGVLSHVPGELVRAGETPLALLPVAAVGLLSWGKQGGTCYLKQKPRIRINISNVQCISTM